MPVTYDKELRERAKLERKGLVTLEWITADGARCTTQLVSSDTLIKYAQLAHTHLVTIAEECG